MVRKILAGLAAALTIATVGAMTVRDSLDGYTSGKECYLANQCDTLATLLQRADCCELHCPDPWYLGCMDEAIGKDEPDAMKTLNWAAHVIDGAKSSPNDTAKAVSFYVACSRSSHARIRSFALVLARESNVLTALIAHNDQGGLRQINSHS